MTNARYWLMLAMGMLILAAPSALADEEDDDGMLLYPLTSDPGPVPCVYVDPTGPGAWVVWDCWGIEDP